MTGYTLATDVFLGRTVARFTCTKCGATFDVTCGNDEKQNPEALTNHCRRNGWQVNAFNPNYTLCPLCQFAKKTRRNDTDSEMRKYMAKLPVPVPMPVAVTIDAVPLREATTAQMKAIRDKLDKHFDADDGCYLNDQSDAKIAEALNLPRIVVEDLRNRAYGPIKISPADLALRNDIAALRALLEQMRKDCDSMAAQIAELESRLAARGVAA